MVTAAKTARRNTGRIKRQSEARSTGARCVAVRAIGRGVDYSAAGGSDKSIGAVPLLASSASPLRWPRRAGQTLCIAASVVCCMLYGAPRCIHNNLSKWPAECCARPGAAGPLVGSLMGSLMGSPQHEPIDALQIGRPGVFCMMYSRFMWPSVSLRKGGGGGIKLHAEEHANERKTKQPDRAYSMRRAYILQCAGALLSEGGK